MKKKSARKQAAVKKAVSRKRAQAKKPARSAAPSTAGKKAPLEPQNFEIVPLETTTASLLPVRQQESLHAWFQLYMGVEGRAGSENTTKAKTGDLQLFLAFLSTVNVAHPDQWTRAVTRDFLKRLGKDGKGASTVNRALATLKHTAGWMERQRPFLAGNPCERIQELQLEAPAWKGLSDTDITRLKTAAEQLIEANTKESQQPVRDLALFLVLLRTGLRVSELLALDFSQYKGKHFVNVQRKGRMVSRQVFLTTDAREALERYLNEDRGKGRGALFQTKNGNRLARQHADLALKKIAAQANATLPDAEKVEISAHVLRHTMLRKAAEKHGVQYAKELSGHASDRYIWRYVQPSEDEKERALEDLF
ncbi:MAG: tyrosine-type recombinase/integrase [Verrucomicrobiae bacterium]|nr:tyrosine-type recombinase/integrase [Verrucomicrobiae bacterium]